jgi:hypothetical protein
VGIAVRRVGGGGGRAIGVLFTHSLEAGWLAEAYLLADNLEDAERTAEYALQVAREHEEQGYRAWILRLQGEIARARDPGRVEPARACLEEARRLAIALDMLPLKASCERSLGTLLEGVR